MKIFKEGRFGQLQADFANIKSAGDELERQEDPNRVATPEDISATNSIKKQRAATEMAEITKLLPIIKSILGTNSPTYINNLKRYNELKTMQAPTNESAMGCCCDQQNVEDFSDDVRNTTVGELLQQIEGNDDDLYNALVNWIREHYQEFGQLEGPPENLAALDSGVIGNIMQTMKSGMGLGGGESITTRRPKIAVVRVHRESKKTKKGPDTKLMVEAFKDLKKNNLI